MPRKTITHVQAIRMFPVSADPRLLSSLVQELRSPGTHAQPLVLEERLVPSDQIQVQVISDWFNGIPELERSELIMEAYRQVEGEDYQKHILVASGFTVPEAIALGLLPFKIVPSVKNSEAIAPEKVHQVMIDEGASHLSEPNELELRYATLEDAESAKQRLDAILSEAHWLVIQEVMANY